MNSGSLLIAGNRREENHRTRCLMPRLKPSQTFWQDRKDPHLFSILFYFDFPVNIYPRLECWPKTREERENGYKIGAGTFDKGWELRNGFDRVIHQNRE